MKRLIALLLSLFPAALPAEAQSAKDTRAFLTQWEGYSVYPITRGNGERVVGIGHNLSFPAPLKPGKSQYTAKELDDAFTHDLAIAMSAARKGVVNFDLLPHDARLVTLSLIWTVGPRGFQDFREYRAALARKDYIRASHELLDSRWRYQVGTRRAEHHAGLLRKLGQ